MGEGCSRIRFEDSCLIRCFKNKDSLSSVVLQADCLRCTRHTLRSKSDYWFNFINGDGDLKPSDWSVSSVRLSGEVT